MAPTHPPARVFIIDDDEAVRDSVALLLESHGFDVRSFASGAEFLAAVDHDASGCVLLDLHMPVLSGLDLLTRHAQRFAGLSVVVVTGRGDAATRAQVLQAGAVDYLEKPVAEAELLTAVTHALDRGTAS